MKKLAILTAVSAIALSANAAPLFTIGDQLDVFFKGAVTGAWNSNVTLRSNDKQDDYYTTIRLGADANYGRNGKFKSSLKFYEDMNRYLQRSEYNSNLANVMWNATYTETALTVAANFGFHQNKQNSSTTIPTGINNYLVRYNSWNAYLDGSYNFSEKMSGELGFHWDKTEYTGRFVDLYADNDMYAVPVSLLYAVTEKVSLGLSFQYRHTEFSNGPAYYDVIYGNQRDDYFMGVTARGEILPKLTGSIFFGSTIRDNTNGGLLADGSSATMALNATLGYEVSEKLGVFARGWRDFGNGAQRQTSINTGCEIGANYAFSTFVKGTASLSYVNYNYQNYGDREDNNYIGRVGVSYIPTKFLSLAANYRYMDNASNQSAYTYNQHLVDITVSVKY